MAEVIVDGRGSGNYVGIDSTNRMMVVGSITDMPSISVSAGSESYIKGGSIEVTTGSIHVNNFAAGTGYAGSEIWIQNMYTGSFICTRRSMGS